MMMMELCDVHAGHLYDRKKRYPQEIEKKLHDFWHIIKFFKLFFSQQFLYRKIIWILRHIHTILSSLLGYSCHWNILTYLNCLNHIAWPQNNKLRIFVQKRNIQSKNFFISLFTKKKLNQLNWITHTRTRTKYICTMKKKNFNFLFSSYLLEFKQT